MRYIFIAIVIAIYVGAFALAAEGHFALALALGIFASGAYRMSRPAPLRF
jgi:hypothetical protein